MKKTNRRLLAILLSFAMILSTTASSFAAEEIAAADETVFAGVAVEAAEAAEARAAGMELTENADGKTRLPAETSGEIMEDTILGVSSIGDLWEDWDQYAEDSYRPAGSGTEADPFILTSANHLRWLSVNTVMGTSGIYDGWFELGNSISLSAVTDWHPIGWYKNASESGIGSVKAFQGHFDGRGKSITDLDVTPASSVFYAGLFGVIDSAEIRNLTINADTVTGYDFVGILAGRSLGKTTVKNVTVTGKVASDETGVSASAHIGGIIGYADGGSVADASGLVMENVKAGSILMQSAATATADIGGIIGYAEDAYIVDAETYAPANSGGGITGCGYIGGIAGEITDTMIYNSGVDGTIGGAGSLEIGGIVGRYNSGEIVLARMDGVIGNSGQGTRHEGIFVGNYGSTTKLVYGNTAAATAAYLFFDGSGSLDGLPVCGSGFADDNRGFTKEANIGFWTGNELKYTLLEGNSEYPCGENDFYYEELEAGARYIVVQKLNRNFNVQDYARGLRFSIDHFAPGSNGSPVRGYLVSIPRIDSVNTDDIDVASFTAQAGNGSVFYKVMDKNTAAAVAPGATVTVHSAAKNDPENGKYYQRVVDETVEPEKLVRPTYKDYSSGTAREYEMTCQTDGSYTFVMPESDTELNILYQNVLSQIVTVPGRTTISIVEIRTGDRKNPGITWRITDDNGHTLCNDVAKTRTEGGAVTEQLLSATDLTPVDIAVTFNTLATDNKVKWSVNDISLLNLTGTEGGYTEKVARLRPEVTQANEWLLGLIGAAEKKQKDGNYVNAIPDTEYTKTAVLTALTDPAKSLGGIECCAHCDVTLSFRIVDRTNLLVEGVDLDRDDVEFTVTRRLTGNRRAPSESWSVSGPQALKATLFPAESYDRNVSWEITGDATTSVSKVTSGTFDHDLLISSVFEGNDTSLLPGWMKELKNADDAAKALNKNCVLTRSGSKKAVVTVTAQDKEKGIHTDTCTITVNYVTVDETPDVTAFALNTDSLNFSIQRILTGDRKAPHEDWLITSPRKLTGSLAGNAPFLENVIWTADAALVPATVRTLSDPFNTTETVAVNFDPEDLASAPGWIGNVIAADDDKWAAEGKTWKRNGSASVEGFITAVSNDVTVPDGKAEAAKCKVAVTFTTEDRTAIHSGNAGSYSSGGGGGGGGASGVTPSGTSKPKAGILPAWVISGGSWIQDGAGHWLYVNGRTFRSEWAALPNPYADTSKGQRAYDWFRFDENGWMKVGWFRDPADGNTYYLQETSDGTMGRMVTGWFTIGGREYYFNNAEGSGAMGALLRNTTTPDGHIVDAGGVKIR